MTMIPMAQRESITWRPDIRIDHYTLEQVLDCQRALGLDREPIGAELAAFTTADSFVEDSGNQMTTIGLKRVLNTFTAQASVTTIDGTTRGRIASGDSSTAFAVGDVDMGGSIAATNQWYQRFDAAPAKATNGVLTCIATFPTGQGNYTWSAWGMDGGTASASTKTTDADATPGLLNRKVVALGAKTSAAAWVFTITLTLA